MQLLTLVSFVFFTGLVGLITYFLTRRDDHASSDGYFLGGRRLTGGIIAGSLLLTNLSTEQLVGLNGAAYTDGLSVMAWEVIAAASLVIMALFFLPRYLRGGITTIPEFLERRFDHATRVITTYIFILAYAVILLPMILYTGATGLSTMLDIKSLTGLSTDTQVLWLMVWMIGIIGSIYAIFGGLRTVAVSDTLNGLGLLVGGLLITWLGLKAVGDGSAFQGFTTLKESHPEKFNSLGKEDQSVPLSTLFTGVLLLNVFYWTTNQQIIQRTLGAKNLAEGQKGVLCAATFKILAPIILVLPGIMAFHLYADENIRPDTAYGTLVRNVLPAPLTGFFAAVMVGAILSTFNSVLNSTATLFSLGIYKGQIKPDASQKQLIIAGKLCGGVTAIFAMVMAPMLVGQESIFGYLQKMNGLYFIPLLSVVVIGLLTRRVPAVAAHCALVIGLVTIAGGYFIFPDVVDQIHEFHFLGIVFASLLLIMLAIGKLKPQAVPYTPADSGAVDLTAWKLAKPFGFGLLLVVVFLYVLFADFSAISS